MPVQKHSPIRKQNPSYRRTDLESPEYIHKETHLEYWWNKHSNNSAVAINSWLRGEGLVCDIILQIYQNINQKNVLDMLGPYPFQL